MTVTQLFEDHWLPVKRSVGLRPNTIAYHEYVGKWVEDRIGGLRVEALTPGVVAKMVAAMAADRLSARSRQAAVGTLKAATAWAARPTVRLVPVDPLSDFHRPSLKGDAAGTVKAWSVDQARQFVVSVAGDRFAACWALMITRGLRRGELAGLRWSAVDLDNRRLTVKVARVVCQGEGDRLASKVWSRTNGPP